MFISKIDNIDTRDEVTLIAQDIDSRELCDKHTCKLALIAILELCFVFLLVRAENAVSHM